jgi:hypothetical protein
MHFQSTSPWRSIIAAVMAVTIMMSAIGGAARADTAGQTSTRNLILGGLAAIAAVILYDNYHHKQVAANSVVGYTRDGGTVYGDGRVVYPNGTVLYTGNRNGTRCSYNGYGVPCQQQAYAYGPQRGNAYGRRHNHHRGDGDQDGDDNGGGD